MNPTINTPSNAQIKETLLRAVLDNINAALFQIESAVHDLPCNIGVDVNELKAINEQLIDAANRTDALR